MKQIFKFICCGNVDDGKSTLIGRMLLDTDNVKKDQLEDARKASLKNGSEEIELAMLLDGLLSEREQQITIDIAHRYFDYNDIRFHILDCPGHKQYTKNMAIAAAEVDAAIVVIDVTKGIQEQTLNHILICSLFGVKRICLCLTKCDLISDKDNKPNLRQIQKLQTEIEGIMDSYAFEYEIIPVSAVTGYNVDRVLSLICTYAEKSYAESKKIKECILHVQAAKLYQGQRYYYAREVNAIEPCAGTKMTVWPNNIPITITKTHNHGCFQIAENVDISGGDCISNCPVLISNLIRHQAFWFEKPTECMLFKHGTRTVHVVHYSDDVLELDAPLIYNNLDDVKQNGFGIFIDVATKKTLGCCVFKGNATDSLKTKSGTNIYIISSNNSALSRQQTETFVKSFNLTPAVLDIEDLENKNIATVKSVYAFASVLKQQGFNVVIVSSEEKMRELTPIVSSDDVLIEERLR